jgi:hypothetical protein
MLTAIRRLPCKPAAAIILFLVTVLIRPAGAQNFPQEYFRPPLDIELSLSGTFGELRNNHFHSGVDFKTQQVEGKPVYAAANGYVSRIKISGGGYGKALYITHPNGYVTVYAHLRKFNDAVQRYVVKEQYGRKSFEVDLFPDPGELVFKKGDTIALSGNTGSSGGPHLHFEIRDGNMQDALNPLLFGIGVPDATPPVINSLMIYPEEDYSKVNGKRFRASFVVKKLGGSYRLVTPDTIRVSGPVSFGISSWDEFNRGQNKNGLYSVELLVDSITHFSYRFDRVGFDETRYINSLIDYDYFIKFKSRVQKLSLDPNNRLGIYRDVRDRGVVYFPGRGVHIIRLRVTDAAGNSSEMSLPVVSEPADVNVVAKPRLAPETNVFTYKTDNTFTNGEVIFSVPGEALYDTLAFHYSREPGKGRMLSSIHHLHDVYTPLHTSCRLSIRPDSVPASLRGKLLLARVDDKGDLHPSGGAYENGFVSGQVNEFGSYAVACDTVAPMITPVNVFNGRTFSRQDTLKIRIADDFSGIGSWQCTLNGRWVLMEYDAKNHLLFHAPDEFFAPGKYMLELQVYDEKGNTSTYKATITLRE